MVFWGDKAGSQAKGPSRVRASEESLGVYESAVSRDPFQRADQVSFSSVASIQLQRETIVVLHPVLNLVLISEH